MCPINKITFPCYVLDAVRPFHRFQELIWHNGTSPWGKAISVCRLCKWIILWIEACDFQADVQTPDGFKILSSRTLAACFSHIALANICRASMWSPVHALIILLDIIPSEADHTAPGLCGNYQH